MCHPSPQTVLYALFPVMAGGMGVAAVHMWAVMRPAAKFKDLLPSVKLQKVRDAQHVGTDTN